MLIVAPLGIAVVMVGTINREDAMEQWALKGKQGTGVFQRLQVY